KSSAVSRGSNACTGAHALNQATPPSIGTRSTVAHGRSCAISIAPTGSTYLRIHPSTAARSTPPLCRRLAGGPVGLLSVRGVTGHVLVGQFGVRPRTWPGGARR